ncbi:MAG: 50S ribosomal protein L13 [Bacteroidales bacterium]|jgi:large subunit ribosomal protein L13
MNTQSYKTATPSKSAIEKKWVLVDAENETLGRLSSKIAHILRGKNKPYFSPHMDCGDNVVVINASKINFTGKKMTDKVYVRYTGYPGGQRFRTPKELLVKKPCFIVEHAVKGMLPKNKLANQLFRNLRVFEGPEHNLEAQKPEKINLNEIK